MRHNFEIPTMAIKAVECKQQQQVAHLATASLLSQALSEMVIGIANLSHSLPSPHEV